MKLGFAKIDITPELPVPMGGYAARTGPAAKVHRPLYCRAMAGVADDGPYAFVALDLLGVDLRLTRRIRQAVQADIGIPAERTTLVASHTHCAVDGIPDVLHNGLWTLSQEHVPRAYRERLTGLVATCVREAFASASPCDVRWYRTECEGIAGDRRHPERAIRSPVHLMQANDKLTGTVKGGLLHFACHPTVIAPSEDSLSPDFPGRLAQLLENEASGGTFLFANGAAGDLSTRHTRRASDAAEADRIGEELYRALKNKAPLAPVSLEPNYSVAQREFHYRDGKDGTIAKTLLQKAWLAGMELSLVPGEAFSGWADDGAVDRLVVGYANDYVGYLPHGRAWKEGGYEVDVCRIACDDVNKLWAEMDRMNTDRPGA